MRFTPEKQSKILRPLLVLMIAGLMTTGTAFCIPEAVQASSMTAVGIQNSGLEAEERWGIKIEVIRTTAEGFMLDFRYRIVNSEKSKMLFQPGITPFLVDQKNGIKISMQNSRLGPMRQTTTNPQVNRIYTIIFSNPNRSVKKGDKVTIVMGDFKAENLLVR
jgi:hypothetical protein